MSVSVTKNRRNNMDTSNSFVVVAIENQSNYTRYAVIFTCTFDDGVPSQSVPPFYFSETQSNDYC